MKVASSMVFVMFLRLLALLALCALSGAQNSAKEIGGGMISSILKEHNDLRSEIASGKFKDKAGSVMPSARRMLRLKWDKKLAAAAVTAAMKSNCKMGPPNDPNVGENQFAVSSNSTITDANKLPIDAIRLWKKEFEESPWDTKLKTKSELIHVLQMVWARTRKIGCGLVTCDGGKSAIVVCDYKPKGNLDNKQVYQDGPMCSFCTPRKMKNKKRYNKMKKRLMKKCKKQNGLCR